jgi:hypothetical protein
MSDQTTGAGLLSTCVIKGTDVRSLVNQLDYFESIYTTSTSCNIVINDASGFSQNANLKNGEDVEIGFGGRSGSQIKMKFEVSIVSDRVRVKDKQDMYTLTAVSSEMASDNTKAIDKPYKDMKLSDMVKQVHEVYTKDSKTIKKDLITNEESEGKQNYVGTGRNPTTVFRWASKEAKSSKTPASNYVYYQDRDGYHFKTISSMLSGSDAMTFSYALQNTGSGGDASKRIISFEQKQDFHGLDASDSGAESHHQYIYDPLTGKVDSVVNGKRDGKGKGPFLGKNTIVGDKTEETKGATPGSRGKRVEFLAAHGGVGKGEGTASKFIQGRSPKDVENKRTIGEHGAQSSIANQLENLVMNVLVPGNISIKPGIKVKLQIPSNQENNELDNRSGSFLVTSVRHIIYKDDKDFKYNCVLECKSDSHGK